jgi:thymidylate synthase
MRINTLDEEYKLILRHLLGHGVTKQTRNGEVLSAFGMVLRHNMKDGFPLLTTKKMHWKSIVTELLWFLRGDTNIKYLVDNGCHIWNGDCYKNFIDKTKGLNLNLEINKDIIVVEGPVYNATPRLLSQEEFINKIKTDDEFAKKWGELGPIYGKQWRSWHVTSKEDEITGEYFLGNLSIDQIANLISELKTNPDSRRLMVNAWNVGELRKMVLPPCHYSFQVYTRELSHNERYKKYNKIYRDRCTADCFTKEDFDVSGIPTRAISLMWNQRSVDTFLGLPFNIASYGLLLEIIAKEVNMVPDELIGNLGDVHLYSNHIEQAKEQIGREPFELPQVAKMDEYHYLMSSDISFSEKIMALRPEFFMLENYQSHPSIKAPLSN